jgi:tetratricopeptide (TPR) repeat protein
MLARAGKDPLLNIHMMEDHDSAYGIWKKAAVQGRTLVHFDGHLDFNWIDAGQSMHIGNFIYPAMREGLVRDFYWVVPDSFWESTAQRKEIQEELEGLIEARPREASALEMNPKTYRIQLMKGRLTVGPLASLPRFLKPVLLDIDVDYFVTGTHEAMPPYYVRRPRKPWLWPSEFMERLKAMEMPVDLTTFSYSVNKGFTPLRYKYLGDSLRSALEHPEQPVVDDPLPGSAAAAYETMLRQLGEHNQISAKDWWQTMIQRDPSYRTLYATAAYREETSKSGNLKQALDYYDELIALDPEWHVPYFGKGRVFWHLGKRSDAENAFQRARELSPGPTFATYWFGLCALWRGDRLVAERSWKEAAKQFPKDQLVQRSLAELEGEPFKIRRKLMSIATDILDNDYVRQSTMVTRQVADEFILVPIARKMDHDAALYTLDPVAAFLWEQLAQPKSGRDLCRALQNRYDVDEARAEQDVRNFLEELQALEAVRPQRA